MQGRCLPIEQKRRRSEMDEPDDHIDQGQNYDQEEESSEWPQRFSRARFGVGLWLLLRARNPQALPDPISCRMKIDARVRQRCCHCGFFLPQQA